VTSRKKMGQTNVRRSSEFRSVSHESRRRVGIRTITVMLKYLLTHHNPAVSFFVVYFMISLAAQTIWYQ